MEYLLLRSSVKFFEILRLKGELVEQFRLVDVPLRWGRSFSIASCFSTESQPRGLPILSKASGRSYYLICSIVWTKSLFQRVK